MYLLTHSIIRLKARMPLVAHDQVREFRVKVNLDFKQEL